MNSVTPESSDPTKLHRRTFASLLGGLASLGLAGQALAQNDPPPIEPRDPDDQIDDDGGYELPTQEPETTPSPNEDSEVILQEAEDGGTRYFAGTGHNLETPFLSVWEMAGAEEGPGLPISEQRLIESDGTVRQDFEAMAFRYDPRQGDGLAVQVMPLPSSVLTSVAPASARKGGNYEVDSDFLDFWQGHGGMEMFGAAGSEAFSKSGVTSQVFANAVMDRSGGKVALRKVNVDLAAKAFPNDASFAPAPPTLGQTSLVSASDGLRLRDKPDAEGAIIAVLADGAEFVAAPGDNDDWIAGYADGFSGWVAKEYLVAPKPVEAVGASQWRVDVWQGATISETNVRSEASTKGREVRTVAMGEIVNVVGWVKGEEVDPKNKVWAKLEDGGYIYSRNVVRAAPVQPPPVPNDAPREGRWIDVHLTQQLIVAYEGRTPVRTVVMTSGGPNWETPPGWFAINYRVANETMDSGAIGAEEFYKLENVLFTQYFTDRGHALHFAWWKSRQTIGKPGSHGCLNLLLDDSRFFWDWADIGTPVICRTS